MLKKLLVTTAVLAFVMSASADPTHTLLEWSSGTLSDDTPYVSYRLNVQIPDDCPPTIPDWNASNMVATVTGATFYQSAANDGNPPDPSIFPYVPDSEFTSYYTSPNEYPNTPYDGAVVGFAGPVTETPTSLQADWYDTLVSGVGDFVIAQMTVIDATPDMVLTVDGNTVYNCEPGVLFPFHFVIPEPSSLALLALGGLALIRRR